MTDRSAERNPIDELAEEFAERFRRGERPALTEYIRKYPDLADEIREVFPALVMMERLKPAPTDLAAEAEAERPECIGDYRLLREVGRGGMGIVYEAEQVSLGRQVALKVLPATGLTSPTYLERFRREAKAAARLHHTNIVPVFGVGDSAGVHYYAMQFIHGEGLDKVLQDLRRLRQRHESRAAGAGGANGAGPLSVADSLLTGRFAAPAAEDPARTVVPAPGPPRAAAAGAAPSNVSLSDGKSEGEYCRSVARVGLQVAEALAYAHKQAVLHRDVKPSNLILDLQGTVWITDFGLAKAEGSDELTHTGDVVGTMRYMAPERFDGASLPQGDVYALGLTLYEMLTLRPAFEETNQGRLMQQVLGTRPPRPRKLDPRIPRDLETIVLKASARDWADRYATAAALAEDLRHFLTDRPIRARRNSLPERLWRWCRRNPVVASLTAAVCLLLVTVAVVGTASYVRTAAALAREHEHRQAAERQREIARAAEGKVRVAAEKARADAARTRHLLYDADMQLAGQIWEREVGTARAVAEILAAYTPRSGQEDLRDFVWRYQWRLLHDTPTFPGHQGFVLVGFSPEGRVLTFDEALLRCWDKVSYREIWRRNLKALPQISCFQLSPTGTLLALGTAAGRVHLYETRAGRERLVLDGGAAVKDVCFSTDGRKLAALHLDNKARIWDVGSGKVLTTLLLQNVSFRDCALSADGNLLILAGHPDHFQVALYRAGQVGPAVLSSQEHTVCCIACSPDGRTIASGGGAGRVELWDTATRKRAGSLSAHVADVRVLAFSPDSTRLCTGGSEGLVSVWDVAKPQRLFTLKGHTADITGLAFRADGQRLVSGSRDGTAKLWHLTAQAESRTLAKLTGDAPVRVAYSPDGKWLAAGGSPATLWDARTGVVERRLEGADCVAFSADGKLLATGGRGSHVQLWEVANGRRVRTLLHGQPLDSDPHHQVVGSLAFSPDGKLLASGFGFLNWLGRDYPQIVSVWEVSSGRQVRVLAHGNTVPSLAFSPDGKTLASACHDRSVRLWAVGSWKEVRVWKGPRDFTVVAFAPGGRQLAAASGDGTIRLWDVASGQTLRTLEGHSNRPFDLAFSPRGKTLASAAGDRTLKLWDMASGRALRTLMGHTHWVFGVAFSPDGRVLASCGADNTVRLWDTVCRSQRAEEIRAALRARGSPRKQRSSLAK
jgi:WD40 repeat protein/serine/threonine protein kinase